MSAIETQRPYPGLVLAGKYRIGERLGAGGMGEVYRASQLNLRRDVAVKILHPQLAVQEAALVRFEREARVAAALDHPNAVEIYDFGKSQGYVYLVMELLSGAPLRALVDEHLPLLPIPRTVRIVSEVAGVLVRAHEIGLVHRDLKPDNVFLEPPAAPGAEERVVVVDFGLAFIDGAADLGRMTREGTVTGTPDYLSPEQSLGKEVGPPSDLYALGCMFYEMLVGRVPFHGAYVQLLTQQVYATPPSLSSVREDVRVPHALDALVMRMLDKDPVRRPTALDVRAELAGFAVEQPERARAALGQEGRAARMISAVARTVRASELPTPPAADERQVAVVGAIASEQVLGLATHGLVTYLASERTPAKGADAVWAPEASPERIAQLVEELGVPVLSDLEPGDTGRLAALLRAGAAEALVRPVRVEELAKKLARAIKKKR
jgi:serine/threonine-protein kinase